MSDSIFSASALLIILLHLLPDPSLRLVCKALSFGFPLDSSVLLPILSFKSLPLLLFNLSHAFLERLFHLDLNLLPLLLLLLKLLVEAILVILEH